MLLFGKFRINILDVFRNFFTEHAPAFERAPATLLSGEHDMEYYNLFQVYLKLYEVYKKEIKF
jgi:hypothetical protein